MSPINEKMVLDGMNALLSELVDGPAPGQGTWILDRDPQAGIAGTLKQLSAAQASQHIVPEESSIAGHANHILFSITLLNRRAAGENPFAGADWQGAWKVQTVDEEQWQDLQRDLMQQAHAWMKSINVSREWDDDDLTGAIATMAHLAYHLGAIRNMLEAAKQTPEK
ncbi:MAG: hypothetical protein LLF89_02625 [Spirochaetaceae bacterium]|nr:hypothetical protein [Spirochaetaceae bacterium]